MATRDSQLGLLLQMVTPDHLGLRLSKYRESLSVLSVKGLFPFHAAFRPKTKKTGRTLPLSFKASTRPSQLVSAFSWSKERQHQQGLL